MKETQTASKLSTRSAENRTGRSKYFQAKKSKKISNKRLNDISELFSEESVDFSQFSEITEISEENLTEDATISSLEEPASVTLLPPEKVIYTIENSSTDSSDVCVFELIKFTGMEDNAGLLYKKLKDEIIEYVLQDLNHNVQPEGRSHMLYKKLKDEIIESVLQDLIHNVQPEGRYHMLYKKLKDEIIEYVLQDLNHNVQPEDRSHMQPQSQVVSWKKPFLFLCVIIWFIGVLAVLFFTPDVDCGLVPT